LSIEEGVRRSNADAPRAARSGAREGPSFPGGPAAEPRLPPSPLLVPSSVGAAARGGAQELGGQIAAHVLEVAFVAVAARVLGVAGYGVFRQVVVVLGLAAVLASSGFAAAAVRVVARGRATGAWAEARAEARVCLAGAAVVSAFVSAMIFAGADGFGAALGGSAAGGGELAALLRLGAAYVPLLAIAEVLRAGVRSDAPQTGTVLGGQVLAPAVQLVLGAAALLAGLALAGAVIALTAGAAVGLVAAVVHWRHSLGRGLRAADSAVVEGPILRYAVARSAAALTNAAGLGVGVLLLGALATDREAGLFGAALCLLGAAGVGVAGVASTFAPLAVDLVERAQRARLQGLVQTVTAWTATLALPLLVALVGAPEPFVWLLTGTSDPAGARAFALLAAGTLVGATSGPCTYVLAVAGHGRLNTVTSAVAAAAYLAAGWWTAASAGLAGLALAHGVVVALLGCTRLLQTRLLVGIRPLGRPLVAPLAAAATATAVLLLWRGVVPPSPVGWSVGLAASVTAYTGTLRVARFRYGAGTGTGARPSGEREGK
jgi:O-antigen/teichoic acid export membrane protein